ncbi:MAG: prolipoprotein diacylglyceryl transferase [Candidatus Dadabacteria bacterium]|nr:prolipoprotein diacylglyceryl transferase [Candidatus Dadabacteria bacterium]
MYPELLRIGNFTISSYGVMVALAFLVAYWLSSLEFKRRRLDERLLGNFLIAAMVGGIVGAKIVYLLENVTFSEFMKEPLKYILARGGLTYLGGLLGAALLMWFIAYRSKMSFWTLGDAVAPGLAIAYTIARVGCFLVGDDYGVASNLPWAMAFPKGLPPTDDRVHPTQIYEIILMGALFIYLWRIRKKEAPTGWLFSIFLILAGLERFIVEFVRATTPSPIPHLSLAQLMSIVMVIIGIIKLIQIHRLKVN